MGIKSHDCWTFPLCVDCHREFDQGKLFSKEQKREMADEWIIQTVLALAKNGLVRAVK